MATTRRYKGLDKQTIQARLKQFGYNEFGAKKKIGPILLLLDKLKNPLLVLMIGISAVSFSMGQKSSAIIILCMVTLSAILDFFNTFKSQKAVKALTDRVSTTVTVVRDNQQIEIPLKHLVPDDIVLLSAGNIVPADCVLLDGDDLYINESSLTGESLPVEKRALTNEKDNAQDFNKVFMGTSVITGYGTARVVSTGLNTEFGKIAKALNKPEPKTDFEKSITKFSLFIMRLVFYMVSFVLLIYLVKNANHLDRNTILEAFTFAIAITIGVTPDMLPMLITVCLAKGSQAMAKKEVIVKHLASIENFGSMDILCTDKTGTLTKDHIALVKYIDYQGNEYKKVLELGHLTSHFHTGIANPLDAAINEFEDIDVSTYQKIDEIPYDFERRRSSMVVNIGKKRLLITKGAPEEVLKICSSFDIDGTPSNDASVLKTINKQFEKLSKDGFRVLALSYKELPNSAKITDYPTSIEADMTFSGFLAFLDPPKEGVKETLNELNKLGIEVKILTGDNELLTQKICKDIGITNITTITGKELATMNDIDLNRRILETHIFARINPEQKERIILALKKLGKSVGYMGDGINDAPALKIADVGISVNNATDIAKETAGIILMQKSLESLKDGVIEGRKTFQNTLKYILMGLSSNFGNMFSMMGASAFLPFLPMMPAQILFNNFLYDTSQLSLPTDTVDESDLLKPTHWNLGFIKKYMVVFGLVSSVFDFLTFGLLYYVFALGEKQFQTGWFMESIATQIFVIYIIRTKKIPFIQSSPSRFLVATTLFAVSVAWITPYTKLGAFMSFSPIPTYIILALVGYLFAYLLLVEVVKRLFYRFQTNMIK